MRHSPGPQLVWPDANSQRPPGHLVEVSGRHIDVGPARIGDHPPVVGVAGFDPGCDHRPTTWWRYPTSCARWCPRWSIYSQLRRNTDRQPRTATPPSAWPLPFSSSVASSTGGTAGARTDAYPRTSFDLQFEWGPNGLEQLGPGAAGIVIVDVLRFTTAVSVAIGRGATVLPYRWADNGAETYAAQHNALLAGAGPEGAHWSLSPIDLSRLQPGTLLVLVSPNGSALACGARGHAPHAQVWRAACATPRRWRARRLRRCPPSCRGHRRR
jgi:hypothetical protein